MQTNQSKIEDIFAEAASMADWEVRAAYLDRACDGDCVMRERVQALLTAHDSAESFLKLPDETDPAAIALVRLSEGPGTKIGRYKLLEEIGEGGFGVVFMAEQEEPVRRRVALKIIKAGMDTRQVVARFEAERQALAMMDHPNIARIFDAGATGAGRPYFVMELVKGIPITTYCDQQKLSADARLALFMAVCSAVQHAHQKGIIHRDLKPSNVLVTLHDDKPVPKIIDFGIAKAMQSRLTEKTLFTEFRQLIGTPAYMSPEQAQMIGLDVDTRSDIYSLGVLLYELLTGTTPFDSNELLRSGYDEMRRIIREVEPPRPSTRLSTLAGGDQDTRAIERGTIPRHLSQQLRGDLDWIVMKCLEKDRTRRYDSASALAEDIQRHLTDDPVQACPPSVGYRLKKFVRRNKVAAAFVALLLLSVVGLSASNIAIKSERDARTAALARAQTVSDLLLEMLAASSPDWLKGSQYTLRQWLDDFSARLGDRLAGEPEVEATVRSVIGKSYWRLGVDSSAELHFRKAVDLRRQLFGPDEERVADSLVDYAWSLAEQSRYEEAERQLGDAFEIYREKQADPRAIVRALRSRQNFLLRQSRYLESVEVANEALALAGDANASSYPELADILHDLASAKTYLGKYDEAVKFAERSVELHRRVHGNNHLETAWGFFYLGRALKCEKKFSEAIPPLRQALAIFQNKLPPEHFAIRNVHTELELALQAAGDRVALDGLAREQAELDSRLARPAYLLHLARLLMTDDSPGRVGEARRLIQRASDDYRRVADDSPNDLYRRLEAVVSMVDVMRIYRSTTDFSSEATEANRWLTHELQQVELQLRPAVDPVLSANSLYHIAVIRLRMGDEAGYRATCEKLIAHPPIKSSNIVVRSRPVWPLCLVPNSLDDMGRLVKRAREFAADNSQSDHDRHYVLFVLGAALYRAGDHEGAARNLEESIDIYPIHAGYGLDNINYQQLLLAMAKWKLGDQSEARRLLAENKPTVEMEMVARSTAWYRRTSLELLLSEAETLIGVDSKNDGPETGDSPQSRQSTF